MEQRVRDIIESLQKFDPNLRVSESTIVSFKYDGVKTRLKVEIDRGSLNSKINDMEMILDEAYKSLEVIRGSI